MRLGEGRGRGRGLSAGIIKLFFLMFRRLHSHYDFDAEDATPPTKIPGMCVCACACMSIKIHIPLSDSQIGKDMATLNPD